MPNLANQFCNLQHDLSKTMLNLVKDKYLGTGFFDKDSYQFKNYLSGNEKWTFAKFNPSERRPFRNFFPYTVCQNRQTSFYQFCS
jgi:hypothetical protein